MTDDLVTLAHRVKEYTRRDGDGRSIDAGRLAQGVLDLTGQLSLTQAAAKPMLAEYQRMLDRAEDAEQRLAAVEQERDTSEAMETMARKHSEKMEQERDSAREQVQLLLARIDKEGTQP